MKVALLLNKTTQDITIPRLPSIKQQFPELISWNYYHSRCSISSRQPCMNTSSILITSPSPFQEALDQGIKLRARRKFHEVERIYHCNYPGCNKAYGALNHLNVHIELKGHGKKRDRKEFPILKKKMRVVHFTFP